MKRILGPQIGVYALKTALREKKRKHTLDKILRMANSLGFDHRIRNYTESLAVYEHHQSVTSYTNCGPSYEGSYCNNVYDPGLKLRLKS